MFDISQAGRVAHLLKITEGELAILCQRLGYQAVARIDGVLYYDRDTIDLVTDYIERKRREQAAKDDSKSFHQ